MPRCPASLLTKRAHQRGTPIWHPPFPSDYCFFFFIFLSSSYPILLIRSPLHFVLSPDSLIVVGVVDKAEEQRDKMFPLVRPASARGFSASFEVDLSKLAEANGREEVVKHASSLHLVCRHCREGQGHRAGRGLPWQVPSLEYKLRRNIHVHVYVFYVFTLQNDTYCDERWNNALLRWYE